MRASASAMAWATESARCLSARSRWKARRCAVFGPTPGSRESSVINLSSGSGSCGTSRPLLLQESGREAKTGAERLHLGGGQLPRSFERLVDRRDHQVLQDLHVLGRARV